MLTLTLPKEEFFHEKESRFEAYPEVTIHLEHSLVSLSKWESFWEKPFLSKETKTDEETFSYIECMILDPEIPPGVVHRITSEKMAQITKYIEAKMTATWFAEQQTKAGPSREITTAELLYYWMIKFQIPFECQYWHLERLLTLIRVCSLKESPPKKMSRAEIFAQNRALNAQRRAELGTSG